MDSEFREFFEESVPIYLDHMIQVENKFPMCDNTQIHLAIIRIVDKLESKLKED